MKLILLILVFNVSYSQDFGRLTGSFENNSAYNFVDTVIQAEETVTRIESDKFQSNSYLQLIYNYGDVEFGMRYEAYQTPLLGYDERFQGQGVPYLYGRYRNDKIDITAGSFYEQFGSGLILRAYEERALGIDNNLNGVRVKFEPTAGVNFIGLFGKARNFWDVSDATVRGLDLNIDVNTLNEDFFGTDNFLSIGGSIVSRYQKDNSLSLRLPENVFSYALRTSLIGAKYSIDAEYVHKYNDPAVVNAFTYTEGRGLLLNASYFDGGFSILLNAHKLDNMDFRVDRGAVVNQLTLNFVPPQVKMQTYGLATIYPFATQLMGEGGLQGEVSYAFKEGSLIGGKYGTLVNVNASIVKSTDSTKIDNFLYDYNFFGVGERLFFYDANIEITKKFSDKFKGSITAYNAIYDRDQIEGGFKSGKIYSSAIIVDGAYRFNDKNSIRAEIQHLWVSQDSTASIEDVYNGNWAHFLVEYTIAPKFFITVLDQWNYGNEFEVQRVHYPTVNFAYIFDATRLSIGYGRMRAGLLCVGGICRPVPAANGLNLSLTSSF
jgi:hypothetical protein